MVAENAQYWPEITETLEVIRVFVVALILES
jgi:hypothetical protein